jgi:hypothetical protein
MNRGRKKRGYLEAETTASVAFAWRVAVDHGNET